MGPVGSYTSLDINYFQEEPSFYDSESVIHKPFNFYLKPEFPWKVFKIRFLGLFSDQAFWGF